MDHRSLIALALKEDIGDGDHSAKSCVPIDAIGKAYLLVKEPGIIAGIDVAMEVLNQVDSTISKKVFRNEGQQVTPGDIVFELQGNARSLLTAERTLLNFMQRMSGIATITNKVVKVLEGTGTRVLDTRKTTPGHRLIEKEAVRIGGGVNHRMGLYDMIMIKDNHIDYCGGINQAISQVHSYLEANGLNLKIEIETRDLIEVEEVLNASNTVDRIMLDNFTFDQLKKAVKMIGKKCETEASGGITLDTVRDFALCGVNYVSMGALTHSVKSLDLSLKAEL